EPGALINWAMSLRNSTALHVKVRPGGHWLIATVAGWSMLALSAASLIAAEVFVRASQLAAFQGPAVYHDDVQDYSSNEPTMDGTASAILMWTLCDNQRP